MFKLAVLAAAAVFNVGVVNPDTHLIESYLACEGDHNTAVMMVSAEESHYPDKLLAIFDNDARFAGDIESNTTPIGACAAIIQVQF